MKKLLMYLTGALFLFVSCQSDEADIDPLLVQSEEVLWIKAVEALDNYNQNKGSSDAFKNENANPVTKKWKMLYSRGTTSITPNPNPLDAGGCGDFSEPYPQFRVEGEGIGSLFGKFTLINLGCIIPESNPRQYYDPPGLLGWITTANGEVIFTKLNPVKTRPDFENPGFVYLYWDVIGGEGNRFENVTGWFEIYGDVTANPFEFEGWGEFTY